MMTTRQIERLWTARSYGRLAQILLQARQEGSFVLEGTERPCFVAALAMIRMDELNQSHQPLFASLLRTVLAAQDRDGGFSDPATTALCLRALFLGQGHGVAIDAALGYLANLQKEEGIWPAGPLRRMSADPAASLFVLYQIGREPRFRAAVRFDHATGWFEQNESTLDPKCRALCQWTRRRWGAIHGNSSPTEGASLFAA
jgi:hypothetical protein